MFSNITSRLKEAISRGATIGIVVAVVIIIAVGGYAAVVLTTPTSSSTRSTTTSSFSSSASQSTTTSTSLSSSSSAPSRVTVTLSNLGPGSILFHYTGAALAAALGTYNDSRVNLQVNQINFADVGGYRTAIATGQVDFAAILIDHAFYADGNGANVTGVLNYESTPFNWLAFPPQLAAKIQANLSTTNPNGPFTQKDMQTIVCALKGQGVLLYSAAGFDSIWLNNVLVPHYCPQLKPGTDFQEVYYTGVPATAVAEVQKGEATAAFTSNPTFALVVQQFGWKVVAWQGAFPEFSSYEFSMLATTAAYASAHPDIVYRMVLAQILAVQYAKEHPNQTLAALEKYYAPLNKTVVDDWFMVYVQAFTPRFDCQAVTNALNFDLGINFVPQTLKGDSCTNFFTNQYVNQILGNSSI